MLRKINNQDFHIPYILGTNKKIRTKKTKEQLDNIFKILNDAAEYRSSESNIKLQWIMMIVTILSLIVTLITVTEGSSNSVQIIFDNLVEWINYIIKI